MRKLSGLTLFSEMVYFFPCLFDLGYRTEITFLYNPLQIALIASGGHFSLL